MMRNEQFNVNLYVIVKKVLKKVFFLSYRSFTQINITRKDINAFTDKMLNQLILSNYKFEGYEFHRLIRLLEDSVR